MSYQVRRMGNLFVSPSTWMAISRSMRLILAGGANGARIVASTLCDSRNRSGVPSHDCIDSFAHSVEAADYFKGVYRDAVCEGNRTIKYRSRFGLSEKRP